MVCPKQLGRAHTIVVVRLFLFAYPCISRISPVYSFRAEKSNEIFPLNVGDLKLCEFLYFLANILISSEFKFLRVSIKTVCGLPRLFSCFYQCCGSGPIFFGSGSGSADPVLKFRIRILMGIHFLF